MNTVVDTTQGGFTGGYVLAYFLVVCSDFLELKLVS